MTQADFNEFIDDGRIELPDVPIVFIAYRTGRYEPSLHLNDILYRNHALYHSEHGACPSEDVLTSWAYRGLQGMRTYGILDRYEIERVSPSSVVRRFAKDLEKIHAKSSRTDKLERQRQRMRKNAVISNNMRYRERLAMTLQRLRQGLSYSQVAKALGITVRTVKRHSKVLKGMGKSWVKKAVDSVIPTGDISLSPPITDAIKKLRPEPIIKFDKKYLSPTVRKMEAERIKDAERRDEELDEIREYFATGLPVRFGSRIGELTGKHGEFIQANRGYMGLPYAKLSDWRTHLKHARDSKLWERFVLKLHPSERKAAWELHEREVMWQYLLERHEAHLQRIEAYQRERERDSKASAPPDYAPDNFESVMSIFGPA